MQEDSFSLPLWLPPVGLHVMDCDFSRLVESDEEDWDILLWSPLTTASDAT